MRRLLYIVLAYVLLLSSCARQGQQKFVIQDAITDSTKLFVLPQGDIQQYNLNIANKDDAPKAFYITPFSYDFGTYDKLIGSIIKAEMSDEQKAYALWKFACDWSSHSASAMRERLPHDPLRLYNSFQGGLCDDRNTALAKLFELAGIQSRIQHLHGHVVTEAYYKNSWHTYDADWRIYFTDNTGNVASTEYIGNNPDVIKFEEEQGKGLRTTLGPPILKYLYSSTANNKVNDWFGDIDLDYKNVLTLRKGDEIDFNIQQLGIGGKVKLLLGKHMIANVQQYGALKRNVVIKGDDVYAEHSPYAISKVEVTSAFSEGQVAVYYSSDSSTWQFKGILNSGISNVTFTPNNIYGQAITFDYYLKLIPLSEHGESAISISNSILFSEKVFTQDKSGFKVVPLSGGSIDVSGKVYLAE